MSLVSTKLTIIGTNILSYFKSHPIFTMQALAIFKIPHFFLIIILIIFSGSLMKAESVGMELDVSQVCTLKQSIKNQKIKKVKSSKKILKKPFTKKDNTLGAFIFWWVLMPVLIVGLITLSFALGPFNLLFWTLALSAFSIWAGVSGVVYFPVQMIGFPTGIVAIVVGLILKNLIIWTAGLAILLAAAFAFSYMAIMFTFGTRKYQPK